MRDGVRPFTLLIPLCDAAGTVDDVPFGEQDGNSYFLLIRGLLQRCGIPVALWFNVNYRIVSTGCYRTIGGRLPDGKHKQNGETGVAGTSVGSLLSVFQRGQKPDPWRILRGGRPSPQAWYQAAGSIRGRPWEGPCSRGTAHLTTRRSVPGKQGGRAGEGGQIPGRADQPERRGETALPDGLSIRGRITPARLPAEITTPSECASHLGLGLALDRWGANVW